jgi:uncharacterized protein YecE (DUF72 family)
VLIGCCGWPEARTKYFEHFSAVEMQTTFYQPPSTELAHKWRREAPEGFVFCLKAWQLITHEPSSPTYRRLKTPVSASRRGAYGSFRPTAEVWAAWQHTLAIARALRAAVIVFQCPASFRQSAENRENLARFFGSLEREGRLLAWEPRGDWGPAVVRELCERLDLVHCVDPFLAEPLWGRAVYFRLHGGKDYRHQYRDLELVWLREVCARYPDRPVHVMFNNVFMKQDALRFAKILGVRPSRPRLGIDG